MSNEKLHIIITDEGNCSRTLTLKKKSIRNIALASALTAALLTAGTFQGVKYFKLRGETNELSNQLSQKSSELEQTLQEQNQLIDKYENLISSLKQESESYISSLKKEKEELLEGSISQLDERSKVIQSVMDHIGVEIKIEEDPEHSGGPLIENDTTHYQKLIQRTDKYLEVLSKIPLGRPVPGGISSKYGYRTDPLAKKKAFHSGIDFRGKTGDNIIATADGVVKRSSYTKGLGNYIIISHQNGYETLFAHLKKSLVKKGTKITRGQKIGLIGNTGRSTGSHLHYEIRYNSKTVNPLRYLQVANLSVTIKG